MSTLPDHEIRRLGAALLEPYRDEHVQPASIDLCLGYDFIVFDSHEGLFLDLDSLDDRSSRQVSKKPGEGFILHPGEFILGRTEEVVTIPDNMIARLEGKSSIGRLGIIIHVTAGFIDPGFRGPITLEIANLRRIPIILRPGRAFCQLSFQCLSSSAQQPYQGRYQDASSVEASKYGLDVKEPV